MTRWAISSGSPFEALAGYSRAVVDGEWIFISGTAGMDLETQTFPPETADQARNALAIIGETLAKAGASFADVVQVRVYLASRDDVMAVSKLLGATFADPRPTNTTILCGFPVAEIKVEIEVVARRRAEG
jgi:enamine deaminase RidA (YjgF/YER057c/UK114 family)